MTVLLFLMMFFTVSVSADAGWKQNANGTYSYYSKTGKLVKSKWISGTYYVNKKGIRKTGWLKQKGNYYYFAPSGKLLKNMWIKSEDKMYYAGENGAVYVNGIHTVYGEQYYFNKRGIRLNGKRTSNGNTYYFRKKDNGRMQKDTWVKSNGKYYFCGSDGVILKSQWVGHYYVGKNGYRLTNTWRGKKYLGSDGKAVKGLQEIGKNVYYFSEETYEKVTDITLEIGNDTYEFDEDGKGTLTDSKKAPATKVKVQPTYYSDPYVDDELLLAALVECEAGNQPYEGRVAVAMVVYNRMYSSSFPSKLREVVYQKEQYAPTWDGALTKRLKNQSLIDEESRQAAKEATELFKDYDPEKGVKLKMKEKDISFPYLFFMTPAAYNRKGLSAEYIAIGDHVFFKYWK